MSTTNPILVKLGGSIITHKDKPYSVNYPVLNRLAKEIAQSHIKSLIIGHGGGSFPHTSAAKYQTQAGIINSQSWTGFAKVQNDAAKLNRIVVEALISQGLNAVSIPPSSSCFCYHDQIIDWYLRPIKTLLKNGLTPVPYGDVALDTQKGCTILSTETLLAYLAQKLHGKKIILVGKVDGVLANGEVIKKITHRNFSKIKPFLAGSDSTDVTGGMAHKIETMLSLGQEGVQSLIVNGLVPDRLKLALQNKSVPGTLVTFSSPPPC